MASSNIMVYWASGSPQCWRVLLVLHEKGITNYDQKLISFEKKEQKTEEYLKLNPRGQVPTLKIDDLVITESIASCEFIEKVYGSQGCKLVPEDSAQLASVLQRMHEVSSMQKIATEGVLYYMMMTKAEDRDEETLKNKQQAAADELTRWETYLEQRGDGSHLATKDFSMADAVFFPVLALLVRTGVQLANRLPRLAAYYQMVKERPSVQATWPPHWKGTDNLQLLADVL